MGTRRAQQAGCALADDPARRHHLRQHGRRYLQQREQRVAPALGADVVEHGARRVADVGDVHRMAAAFGPAAGQVPDQPAVDRAEGQLAGIGGRTRARHAVEDPGELGAGEVGIDHEPRALGHHRPEAVAAQAFADIGRTPVLPDDRAVDRLARRPVPHDRGLALVGDADGSDLRDADAGLRDRLARGGDLALPDLDRIVLDPARLREVLCKLALRHRDDATVEVENDAARTGGALVEG